MGPAHRGSHWRRGHALCPGQPRAGDGAPEDPPHLFGPSPLPDGPSGDRRNRGRVQPLRVPRNLFDFGLRPDRGGTGPEGTARSLQVPHHGKHRGHLHRHRHRNALHDDGDPEHDGPGGSPSSSQQPGRIRGIRLPHGRNLPEACPFPPSSVAPRRLHLRAVRHHGVPGFNGYEGGGLYAGEVLLHHLRAHLFPGGHGIPGGASSPGSHRNPFGLPVSHLSEERQAAPGLLQRCPGRLYDPGHQPGFGDRPHRGPPAPLQPCPHQGRPVYGCGSGHVPGRLGPNRGHAGIGQEDAVDHGRLRPGGAFPHRGSGDGGLHQQMVSCPRYS